MRQPRPYFKTARNAWYANLGPKRRPVKLAVGRENEKAAWQKYHILMAGRQPLTNDCFLVDLVQRFVDHHHKNSSKRTYEFYFAPLESFLASLPAKMRVADLRPYHLTMWLDGRLMAKRSRRVKGTKTYRTEDTGRKISQNHKRNLIRAVKAAFHWAVEEAYIDRDPLHNVKAPAYIPRGDEAYLMPDQWDRLIAAVKDQALLDVLTVLKETGCRPFEVRRVEARWLDNAGQCWVFPKIDSKGKMESRVVHLNAKALDICRRLAPKYPVGPMFRNGKGNRWTHSALDGRCLKLSKKLGFHVTPYCVRHTFATDAILHGVDLQTIATILGHKDLRMLSRIYQHIRKCGDHIKEGLRKATGEST